MDNTLRYLHDAVRQMPRTSDPRLFGMTSSQRAVLDPLISALGVQPLRVDDLTETLGLRRGRVFAVRWDLTTAGVGFKQAVITSLLLFHLWRRRGDVDSITTLIDGGNVNTALAVSSLAKRIGMKSEHVLSRYFPADIRDYIARHGGERLDLVEAPQSRLGKEREFYAYLLELMRNVSRRHTHLCLWHARYGGIATRWLGEVFASRWSTPLDDIVLGLGSGSTLQGFAIPLKIRFNRVPRVLIAEHDKAVLLRKYRVIKHLTERCDSKGQVDTFRQPPAGIPHAVLGPHYDDVNPLLPANDLAEIDGTIHYSDATWKRTSSVCRLKDLPVGNSSAANLAVAMSLASEDRTVLTFVYEPLRAFYLSERQAASSAARHVIASAITNR